MSGTIRSHAIRALAATGFLGFAGLAGPAATQAQAISSPRALLNTIPFVSHRSVPVADAPAQTLDGERALLGRPAAGVTSQAAPDSDPPRQDRQVDGEQALLGGRSSP